MTYAAMTTSSRHTARSGDRAHPAVITSRAPALRRPGEVAMSAYGLRVGTADIQSAGPIAFGPEGILFLADNDTAKIFAVDVADPGGQAGAEPFDLANVDVHL